MNFPIIRWEGGGGRQAAGRTFKSSRLETRELNRIAATVKSDAIPHEIPADELLRTDVGIIAFPSPYLYLRIPADARLPLKYRTSSLIGPDALGKLLTAARKSTPRDRRPTNSGPIVEDSEHVVAVSVRIACT